MASKRRVSRRRPDSAEQAERELKKLSRSAKAEMEVLLKRFGAGDITRVQLQTRLKEVHEHVRGMWFFLHKPK